MRVRVPFGRCVVLFQALVCGCSGFLANFLQCGYLTEVFRYSACSQQSKALSESLMLFFDGTANRTANRMAPCSHKNCQRSQVRQLLPHMFIHSSVGVYCILMILQLSSNEFDPAIVEDPRGIDDPDTPFL